MSQDSSRSEQVVNEYKKRKLAVSAYCRIQNLIKGFEEDRAGDTRMALIGVGLIFALIFAAAVFFLSRASITLS